MQLETLVNASAAVAATRSRLKKRAILAECLGGASTDDLRIAVSYLSGTLPQGKIGVGYALLRELRDAAITETATLALADVDLAFDELAAISGKGSKQRRHDRLADLFGACTPAEKSFLSRLLAGELRQGALEALLIDALADATNMPVAALRRAAMLSADLPAVAVVALNEGEEGLEQFRLEVLSPIRPMLAQPAESPAAAIEALGECAFEYKLDGARVQIHRAGDEVRIFTRALNDVTDRVPEVVERVLGFPGETFVLDGEVLALREDGRPQPFQVTMRRFGRSRNADDLRDSLPLTAYLFDCLLAGNRDLIDAPYAERLDALNALVPDQQRIPTLVTADSEAANAFLERAMVEGQEGIMAKSLTATYAAGSRGGDWLKIKPANTLDLVVLAAEWGSGRRKGWLSNLHLGARDGGEFVMLGKTFKGLTDEMLEWQTAKFRELAVRETDHVVYLRPELVVEIAVNEVQASKQYPAGMALRFARVKGYREDKSAAEADTVETVRNIFRRQFGE